jgi:hypothetical protein
VEPQRIRLSQAEGNEPLSSNLDPDELDLNSRVDVILLPDYADIPWRKSAGHVVGSAGSDQRDAPRSHGQDAADDH